MTNNIVGGLEMGIFNWFRKNKKKIAGVTTAATIALSSTAGLAPKKAHAAENQYASAKISAPAYPNQQQTSYVGLNDVLKGQRHNIDVPEPIRQASDQLAGAYIYGLWNVRINSLQKESRLVAAEILQNTRNTLGLTEPAWYFVRARTGVGAYSPNNFEKRNPALWNFAVGLGEYFSVYVDNDWKQQDKRDGYALRTREWHVKEAENGFLASIFICANNYSNTQAEKDVVAYQQMPIDQKARVLQNLRRQIEKSKDINIKKTFAWSALMITSLYDIEKNKTNADITYNFLEKNTKELIGYIIRGNLFG